MANRNKQSVNRVGMFWRVRVTGDAWPDIDGNMEKQFGCFL